MPPSDPLKKESPQSEIESSAPRKFVQGGLQTLIQWVPTGTTTFLVMDALRQQQWFEALALFPVCCVTAVWTAYSKAVIARFSEIYDERGKRDVDSVMAWVDQTDQVIRWQFAGTDAKYLKCQGSFCHDYETDGYRHPAGNFMPLLGDVFVPLELSNQFLLDDDGNEIPNFPGFRGGKVGEPVNPTEMLELTSNIWEFLIRSKTQSVFRRLAIKAWGGYGKTTLLRHLTYCYVNDKIPKQYRRRVPKLLPVLIALRQWQNLLLVEMPPDLPTLIEQHHFRSFSQCKDLPIPPNWAKQHLLKGDFLVMFDGFDEVIEGCRVSMSEWIARQMSDYPACVFIITSRPKAFDLEYKVKPDPAKVWVKEFKEIQQEQFIYKWNLAQERFQRMEPQEEKLKDEARRITTNLMGQLKERHSLGDLAKNPLLLNMIVNLHRFYRGNPLPKRRARLYEDIFKLQLQDRPQDRNIDMVLELEDALSVLQWVAFVMVRDLAVTRIEKADLLSLIERSLELENLKNETSAEKLLGQVEDISELIVKRDDQYEFAHRSFQEFLAARYIKQENLADLLLNNWAEEWWNGTTILYVASLKKPSDFIRQLLQKGEQKAKDLAIKCWQETPRELDQDLLDELTTEEKEELKNLDVEVKNALYQQLEEYLKNQQFKEADKETDRVMLQVVGKESNQYLDVDDIKNFPCEDLKIIDDLWKKYSNGKFGFSVQKQIWLDCGGIPGDYDYEKYKKFAREVKWLVDDNWVSNSNINFTTEVVLGHLPYYHGDTQGGHNRGGLSFIFSRVAMCEL